MKDDKKDLTADWNVMSRSDEEELVQMCVEMAIDHEGIARVLGVDHPIVGLIGKALETGGHEEVTVARSAYEALPEAVLNRARHPWIGHPPPHGTRHKLRKEQAGVLVGELDPGPDPVGCYLQVDAREAYGREYYHAVDNDGHVVDCALVYDFRVHTAWPVRVQVAEGSDKETVLALLRKIQGRIEMDRDNLTDATRYLNIPEDLPDF
jgi:hypothetical protein